MTESWSTNPEDKEEISEREVREPVIPERWRARYADCMGPEIWYSAKEMAGVLGELGAAEAALSEAQRQNEARWIIWGNKVEALEQQLRDANQTISQLREEIEDDNTAVRQVARECRLDDERTIAQQAATIATLSDALNGLMKAYGASDGRNRNSGECWDKARAALASIPQEP
jgi:hypothetical protein